MQNQINFFILFITFLISSCSTQKTDYKKLIQEESTRSVVKFDTSYYSDLAKDYLIKGSVLQQKGNFAESILQFQEAYKYDNSYTILYAMSLSYIKLGNFSKTRELSLRILDENPDFLPSIELLTNLYFYNNEIKKAKIFAEKAYSIESSDENLYTLGLIEESNNKKNAIKYYNKIESDKYKELALLRLFEISKSEKDIASSKIYLDSLLIIQPYSLDYNYNILVTNFLMKDVESAFENLKKIDSLFYGEELENLYILFGTNLWGLGSFKDSIRDYNDKVIEFVDKVEYLSLFNSELYFISGYLLANIDENMRRDKFFRTSLKLTDTITDFTLEIPNYYFIEEEYEIAMNLIIDIENYFGINPMTLQVKSLVYSKLNQFDSALATVEKAINIDTTEYTYFLYETKANIFYEMKNYDSSIYYYHICYEYDSTNIALLNNYSYTLAEIGINLDFAKEMSRITIEKFPEQSSFLDTYAWILYQLGDYEVAKEYIDKAFENNSGKLSFELLNHKASIYEKLGLIKDAIDLYNKAFEINPESEKIKSKINELMGK